MSDILINNMELPKEGSLVIEITKHGQVAQLFKDGSLLRKGVKAIELPPHGDLIERDKLPHYKVFSIIGKGTDVVDLEDIKNAPTVLEATE